MRVLIKYYRYNICISYKESQKKTGQTARIPLHQNGKFILVKQEKNYRIARLNGEDNWHSQSELDPDIKYVFHGLQWYLMLLPMQCGGIKAIPPGSKPLAITELAMLLQK